MAIKQVRRFVANSTAGVEYLAGEMGIPRQRIFLVPNGVEETVMDRGTDWRTKLGLKPEQPLVVSVAVVDRTRDHATLLHAWKIVQDALPGNTRPVLALAGGFGDAYAECRQVVRKGGLDSTVRFLGMIHDVPALIQASDLAVFSSHGEGVPNGVLECMAGGKAVIASNLAGVRDALGPNAAEVLVSPGDADQFARKILDLLRDKEKRQALGEANRARVRSEFRVEDMAKRYFDIIQDDARPVSAGGGDGTARAWEAENAPNPARRTEPMSPPKVTEQHAIGAGIE
jgi:glycosyltransferase involved in cell wall biosynthesis